MPAADKSFWGYLVPYRLAFFRASFASVSNKVLDLMPPLLVGWVIDTVQRRPPEWLQTLGKSAPVREWLSADWLRDPALLSSASSLSADAVTPFSLVVLLAAGGGVMLAAERTAYRLSMAYANGSGARLLAAYPAWAEAADVWCLRGRRW